MISFSCISIQVSFQHKARVVSVTHLCQRMKTLRLPRPSWRTCWKVLQSRGEFRVYTSPPAAQRCLSITAAGTLMWTLSKPARSFTSAYFSSVFVRVAVQVCLFTCSADVTFQNKTVTFRFPGKCSSLEHSNPEKNSSCSLICVWQRP